MFEFEQNASVFLPTLGSAALDYTDDVTDRALPTLTELRGGYDKCPCKLSSATFAEYGGLSVLT
jgi:hypothetical protein